MEDSASSYANVIEELLLALVGFSGDVFCEKSQSEETDRCPLPHPDRCNISLSYDLSWVDAPDREQLNQLVHLGYHIQALRHFIDMEHGSIGVAKGTRGGSIYRRALATGLQEVVDVYQAAVLQLQLQVLGHRAQGTSSGPVLALLHHHLHDFQLLLPQLHRLVYQLLLPQLHRLVYQVVTTSSTRAPSNAPSPEGVTSPTAPPLPESPGHSAWPFAMGGAQLLALLQAAARCGVPVVQSCMQRLLWHCNQVLFKQLTSWMVHGKLLDPHDEFFIKQKSVPQDPHISGQPLDSQTLGDEPGHVTLVNWHDSFQVHDPDVPPHISSAAAESVAFIGKAVLLLKNPAGAFRGADLLRYKDTLEFTQALRTLQAAPVFDRVAFERTVEGIRAKVAAMLWHLVVVQADLMAHLNAIKDYYLMAKGELYHSFLVDARKVLAAPPRPHTADADVNIAFQQAALKSTAQHDTLFPRFRIHWAPPQPPPDPSHRLTAPAPLPSPANAYALPNIEVPRFDANWDSMWLGYEDEWPLGLLFTPQVIARYNALFQMLLRLKRVQLRLEEAWQALSALDQWHDRNQAGRRRKQGVLIFCAQCRGPARLGSRCCFMAMRRRDKCAFFFCDTFKSKPFYDSTQLLIGPLDEHTEGNETKATLQDLRQLRHHMSHLISNLQIYIQVDVIESNFSQLEARIAAAQDFSEVERAHANYLHALMQQTFLNTTTICRTISALFQHVQELCQLVDAASKHASAATLSLELGEVLEEDLVSGSLLTPAEQQRLATTRAHFSQRMTELYTFLHSTRLQDVNKAPHLRQFYLRLNFNEYVSRKIVISSKVVGLGGTTGRPSGVERPPSAVAALMAARRGG